MLRYNFENSQISAQDTLLAGDDIMYHILVSPVFGIRSVFHKTQQIQYLTMNMKVVLTVKLKIANQIFYRKVKVMTQISVAVVKELVQNVKLARLPGIDPDCASIGP